MNWFNSRIRRFWQWIRRHPKKITIPVTCVIVGAISLGGVQFGRFYNYTQTDPNFCQSCHLMQESWDRWDASSHKDISCHDCHQQSLFTSAKQVISFAFASNDKVEKHAVVLDEVCMSCHESGSSMWIQVAATSGHKVHAEEQNIACVKCHSVTMHRFEPPGQICIICHEDKPVQIEGMADNHCAVCHDFLAGEEHISPEREGCLECHQAQTELAVDWPADAPMQYPCGDCHKPHEQVKQVVDCQSCHTVEGVHLAEAHSASSCITCHKPHNWSVAQRETCLTCHPGKAEHNAGNSCSSCHNFPGK
ncbi:MAG: hypothetical protein FJW66_04310 [Actinobacteria bacterium]|nr:hypothetical protein [Actinomycetota bacterium]